MTARKWKDRDKTWMAGHALRITKSSRRVVFLLSVTLVVDCGRAALSDVLVCRATSTTGGHVTRSHSVTWPPVVDVAVFRPAVCGPRRCSKIVVPLRRWRTSSSMFCCHAAAVKMLRASCGCFSGRGVVDVVSVVVVGIYARGWNDRCPVV